MSSGSKVTLIAIIVILLGTGAYEIFKTEEPEGEKTAAKMAEPAAVAPTTAPEAAVPAAPEAATGTAPATAPAAAPATDAATAPATEAATAPAADATAPAPATEAAADSSTAPTPAPTESAAAPAPASSFDVIRVAPDGAAVVAGQVAPGSKVSLLVDGIEIAAPIPDANGKFVALFTLPAAGAGRLMTMITTLPDGTMTEAGAAVALAATSAPAAAPAAVADAGTTSPAPAEGATTAPAAPAPAATGTTALVVTDQGAKLVQSGTPVPAEVAANVSLEVIAYPTPDSVQFAGHGTAGAFVRLYLDNAALGEAAPIGTDGAWTVTEAGIAPKIYTLRVDEVDATGKVTSRFETPFKRETPEALAAAAQAASAATPAPASGTASSGTAAAPSDTVATAPAASPSTSAVASPDAAAPAPETAPSAEATAAAPAPAPAAESPPAPPASVSVTVQPGYTLWGIARKQMGSGFLYVQVWEANKDKIRNPDLIYPGQVFTLPKN